jgi:hypothetical protein
MKGCNHQRQSDSGDKFVAHQYLPFCCCYESDSYKLQAESRKLESKARR